VIRESPLDKCLRESLSGKEPRVCGKRPTRLLTEIKTTSQDLNEVRLKAQLYRVYRVYIGQRPYERGPCVSS